MPKKVAKEKGERKMRKPPPPPFGPRKRKKLKKCTPFMSVHEYLSILEGGGLSLA